MIFVEGLQVSQVLDKEVLEEASSPRLAACHRIQQRRKVCSPSVHASFSFRMYERNCSTCMLTNTSMVCSVYELRYFNIEDAEEEEEDD